MSTQITATAAEVAGQRVNATINGIVNATINGIVCDTTTAECVSFDVSPGHPVEWQRFDEAIYRNDQGMWFVVRPLDPEEAREWLERVNSADAHIYFPDGPPRA